MKKQIAYFFIATISLGFMAASCEKLTFSNDNDPEATTQESDIVLNELKGYGERISVSGEPVLVDMYTKWEGWPPETMPGYGYESCYTNAGDCTCIGGICGVTGLVSGGTLNGTTGLDPTAIQTGEIFFTTGNQLVIGFASDPSILVPPVNPNNIVPISANFFVDPAIAASLGYTSIEIHAGNYVTDYSYNPNGEILVGATAL